MKCFYINLDAARDRRATIEADFARHMPGHWELTRFPAIDVKQVAARGAKGRLRPAEIACFMSHLDVIAKISRQSTPALVLEDDACFGPHSATTIENCVRHLELSGEWDALFADVGVVQIGAMAELVISRRTLIARGQTRLIDLKGLPFMGANAYVLHPRGAKKIAAAAQAIRSWDVPYDLFLRQLINASQLSGRAIFPFATSVSDHFARSAIQPEGAARTDLIWNLFRQMVWRDGAVEPHLGSISDLSKDLTMESKAYAILWAAMADPSFQPK